MDEQSSEQAHSGTYSWKFTLTEADQGIAGTVFATATGANYQGSLWVYPAAVELITNGTMEADANWANFGSPPVNERSAVQAHSGTYSRKFTINIQNSGLRSDVYTTVAGLTYSASLWVFPVDVDSIEVWTQPGTGAGFSSLQTFSGLTLGEWNEIEFEYEEVASGAAANMIIKGIDGVWDGTWYVDDVSIQDLVTEKAVRVKVRSGSALSWLYNEEHTDLTPSAWNLIEFTFTETLGGSGAYVLIQGATDAVVGTWYIDDVSIKSVSTSETTVDEVLDPQAMLRWSDDDGNTWSNEHWVSMGKIGEYKKRAVWRRLGNSRARIYELVITDPVKRVLTGAQLDAEVGDG